MSNFFLLHETLIDHRDINLKKEIISNGFNFIGIDIYKSLCSYKSLENFNPKKGDVVWLSSNALVGHQLLKNFAFDSKAFCWPNLSGIDFADKFNTACFFIRKKIKTPKTVLLNSIDSIDAKISAVDGFPCVVKRTNGSHGSGVSLARSKKDLLDFFENEFISSKRPKSFFVKGAFFILQKFIPEASNSDFRVLCFDDEIIGGIKRTSQNNDFRANVSLGGKAEIFPVPNDLAKISKKIMLEGKLFYAGIDFIKSGNDWLAIEINTLAQFKGFEEATGINVAKKIVEKLISRKILK